MLHCQGNSEKLVGSKNEDSHLYCGMCEDGISPDQGGRRVPGTRELQYVRADSGDEEYASTPLHSHVCSFSRDSSGVSSPFSLLLKKHPSQRGTGRPSSSCIEAIWIFVERG